MKAPRNSKTHRWGVLCRSARGQLPSLLGSSVQGAIRVVSSSSECCGISTSTREAEQGTGHHVLGFYTFNNFFLSICGAFLHGKGCALGVGVQLRVLSKLQAHPGDPHPLLALTHLFNQYF